VSGQHYFKDKYLLYRFTSISDELVRLKSTMNKAIMEQQLHETIELLSKIGPDATLRMILRKP
jgi:Rap guanine nucleotide exchange factor 4